MWRSTGEGGSQGGDHEKQEVRTTEQILSGGNVMITSSEAGQGNSSASTSTSGN